MLTALRRHHLLWLGAAIPVALLVAVAAFGAAWLSAPNVSDLRARVLAIARSDHARPVGLGAIAPLMRQAVVATEDERFYQHDGVDVLGLLRAIPYDLSHLSLAQGASTITEQLAKLVYLGGNDHNPWAKLRDAAIALRIESRFSKDQILAAYLNTAYFGGGAFGVQAASRLYFGLPARELGVAEASLLAGLIQDPSGYDPYAHPVDARQRQAEVLRSMIANGFITDREGNRALARPLSLARGRSLPPLAGIDLEPGPAFYWPGVASGVLALLLGSGALLYVGRHAGRAGRAARVISQAAAVLVGLGGILVIFASFRTV